MRDSGLVACLEHPRSAHARPVTIFAWFLSIYSVKGIELLFGGDRIPSKFPSSMEPAHYGLKEDDKTRTDWHFLIFTLYRLLFWTWKWVVKIHFRRFMGLCLYCQILLPRSSLFSKTERRWPFRSWSPLLECFFELGLTRDLNLSCPSLSEGTFPSNPSRRYLRGRGLPSSPGSIGPASNTATLRNE